MIYLPGQSQWLSQSEKNEHTLSSTLSAFFHIHSSSSSLNSDLNTSLQIGHVMCFASSPGGTTTNRARSSASRLALSAVAMALTFDKRNEGPASLSPLLNGKSRIQSYAKHRQSQSQSIQGYCVAHLSTKEPTATMTSTNALRCLTVLPEMHIEMFLHGSLVLCRVGKSETTLLTLYGHTVIEKMYYVRAMSAGKVSLRILANRWILYLLISALENFTSSAKIALL